MKKIAFVLLALLIPALVFGTDATVTYTSEQLDNNMMLLTASWQGSATNGVVNLGTTSPQFNGFMHMVVTKPGASAPTNLYDITLTDSDGIDVMGGALADRSSTAAQQVFPVLYGTTKGDRYVNGGVTVNISNQSTASALGVIKMFIKKEKYN